MHSFFFDDNDENIIFNLAAFSLETFVVVSV